MIEFKINQYINELVDEELKKEYAGNSLNNRKIFYVEQLFYFSKDVLGYKKLSEDVHKPWADSMQDRLIKRRLRLKPRGTYKTSLYTISYPIWRLMNNPDLRIAICSGNLDNALDSSLTIKRHLQYNQNLIEIFGEFYDKNLPWTQTSFSIKGRKDYNKKESSITSIGFGTQITGKHFDLIIVDDIVNNDDRESRIIRKKKQRWFEDLISILDPEGEVLIVGTRWHFDDFYNYIINELNPKLNSEERYDIEIEGALNHNGEPNFPSILPAQKLEILKIEKGLVEFNSQYLNSPIAAGTQIFFEEDFHTFEISYSDLTSTIAYLDPSMGKNYESDYSALVIGQINSENELLIIDAIIERILPDKIFDLVSYNFKKYNIKTLGIESNCFQEYLVEDIRKQFADRNVRIEKIKNYTNKEIRIQSLQPLIKRGIIKFRKDMRRYYPLLIEQLLLYPAAKNDDGPDALEGLFSLSQKIIFPVDPVYLKEDTTQWKNDRNPSRIWL